VAIRIPVFHFKEPLPEDRDGVRIPHELKPDLEPGAAVILVGGDGKQRNGRVARVNDQSVEIDYTD
jgi:hypothetical protein